MFVPDSPGEEASYKAKPDPRQGRPNGRDRARAWIYFAIGPKGKTPATDNITEKELKALTAIPYQVSTMLRTYGRQVTTARRLARYRRSLQAAGAEDEVRISQEAKRRELVTRVAAEIVENCIVTGSDSPIVAEIKAELEEALGYPLLFAYPPEEQEMQLFRLDAEKEPEELVGQEKAVVFKRLWELALEKVDETML